MDKQILSIYKVPLLTSVVLFVVLLAMDSISEPLNIIYVLVACLLGVVILDLEYIVYAYFLEPEKDFSKTVVGFIKHKDFTNLIKYIEYHRGDINEKAVNSGLFQIALAIFGVFALSASTSLFIKSLIISIYVNLLYKSIEAYFENKTDEWFWAFKKKPDPRNVVFYLIGLSMLLVYYLFLF